MLVTLISLLPLQCSFACSAWISHCSHLEKIKKWINLESGPLPFCLALTAVDSKINQFLLYTEYSKCIPLYLKRNKKEKENPANSRPNKAGLLQL